jgi:glycosyltransferase involved in cell wall biosynthesis
MSASLPPKVSVVIPVLNAAGILGNCLRSIREQEYPQHLVEVLVADGRSSDDTRRIAELFGARVLDNPRRIAEQGKRVALGVASGELVLFLDADNELSHSDFLRLASEGLCLNPQAMGVESYYPASSRMGSLCRYLNATLHIGDPISWLMSVSPVLLGRDGEVERWGFPKGSMAYPLGANGFVFRMQDLVAVRAAESFEDTHVVMRLVQGGSREWLRLSGRGVYHYLVKGLFDFMRKRRRQAYHFLSLRGKGGLSWTAQHPRTSPLLACVYCATFLGPLFHTGVGLWKHRDIRWLWHPVACVASLVGLAWGVATYWISPRTADVEAGLQPAQTIEKPLKV